MKVSKDEALLRVIKLIDTDLAGLVKTLDDWGTGPWAGVEESELPTKEEALEYLRGQDQSI